MFKFLKEKLKSAVASFSKKIEEQPEKQIEQKPAEEKGFFEKLKDRFVKPEDKPIVQQPIQAEEKKAVQAEPIIETAPDKPVIRDEPAIAKPKIQRQTEKPPQIAQPTHEPEIQPPAPIKTDKKIDEPEILAPSEPVAPISDKPDREIAPSGPEAAEKKEEKGFFSKLTETFTTRAISEDKFNEIFWDLEVALLENNVALEVVEKIKSDLKQSIMNRKVKIGKTEQVITESLAKSIDGLFAVEPIDIVSQARDKKPYVIVFVGVNGSGKTTTIAKMANLMQKSKLSCVIAAADTFRAAAIQQLEEHANKLNIKLIKHDYGSDPAAVAFDAVKYAEARNIDVVLIDTAGRLHSNTNLMDEMRKIVRVAKPDLKIFVGEAITGNDCVEQARQFNEAVGIDAIILAKADVDEKGGAAVSVSYVTHKPIVYLGTGQGYDNLTEFSPRLVTESLGL